MRENFRATLNKYGILAFCKLKARLITTVLKPKCHMPEKQQNDETALMLNQRKPL